jgi:hypothetical protein
MIGARNSLARSVGKRLEFFRCAHFDLQPASTKQTNDDNLRPTPPTTAKMKYMYAPLPSRSALGEIQGECAQNWGFYVPLGCPPTASRKLEELLYGD